MQKGFSPTSVLVGICLTALAVAGVYYLKPNTLPFPRNNSPQACTQEAKQCPDGSFVGRSGPNCEFAPCPSPTPSQTPDETASWKAYINHQNAFSIQYPQAVIIKELNPNEITMRLPDDTDNNLVFDLIFININPAGVTDIKQAIKSYDATKLSSNDIVIGGIKGLYFDSVPAAYEASDAFVIKNGLLFAFRIEGNSPKFSENKKIFNQILSTFKFLDGTLEERNYVCPKSEWVNCMPGPDFKNQEQCSEDFLKWAKSNCPSFKGGAY
ncbi:MAG: hypothetical protein UU73_C0002G0160 [Candidatus Daviesbacteria bacterium GW2011_GWA1_41_61]|uniref:Uncharacterized protein n=1 Tax=Candidatus Daviesbacteria bacterium GW2011_GWA2_40_9 TaxID=1618424 RepID=A0A0G0U2W2_9BACT|nr:MAG: hypothetical protein UU26_C0009G0041 [Candidatus Daviesbacteria bacterium GW2011_GWC1_40_9]KKR83438.1 MAG: hypothetical protein UU29_C0005G0019 [Candidatus Daviesbacteria bacterium GW2011_GWA2_40_9]KKR93820.1 MAG: hypothetical protein UU44_C0001G0160 [Candidatus Daviesbacteria bacterium GW2011_GWB1_41_15]KKS15286.1 MAG: hypothetical protein UU73_C0002G0160 [Candidatus Daviesbacteria bacterium GW2011_GWA1_41_61]